MNSVVFEGKVLDWKFTKSPIEPSLTYFYLDEFLIGNIFKVGKNNYTVASNRYERTKHLYPVSGFKSRYDAAEFLLKDSIFREKTE